MIDGISCAWPLINDGIVLVWIEFNITGELLVIVVPIVVTTSDLPLMIFLLLLLLVSVV